MSGPLDNTLGNPSQTDTSAGPLDNAGAEDKDKKNAPDTNLPDGGSDGATGATGADDGNNAGDTGKPGREDNSGDKSGDDSNANDDASSDDSGDDSGDDVGDDEKDTSLMEEHASWGSTGDENGDAVLDMLKDAKVTQAEAEAILFEAVRDGKPEAIKRELLEEKVGKAQATLIINAAKSFIETSSAHKAAVIKTIHDEVGGKENWDKLAGWAREGVDPKELTDLAAMIDKGGAQAKFAAQELKSKYEADPKNSSLNASLEVGDTNSAADDGEALTVQQYGEQMLLVHKKHMSEADRAKEIARIKAARARGRKAGI